MHGSVSAESRQRIEAEESACGKVHELTHTITEIYFQEIILCNFLVKNGNYRSFKLDFGNVNAQFRRNIPGVTRRSAKRISYSELGFASRIIHHNFILHGL